MRIPMQIIYSYVLVITSIIQKRYFSDLRSLLILNVLRVLRTLKIFKFQNKLRSVLPYYQLESQQSSIRLVTHIKPSNIFMRSTKYIRMPSAINLRTISIRKIMVNQKFMLFLKRLYSVPMFSSRPSIPRDIVLSRTTMIMN